ncbi:cytochrome P450 [Rhodococcus qingshengii]|uniref:cytochrome P450 n=1 Tax=Rhodococcus qingshengii TaxID=334542 RepID=UPI001BEBFB5D|nr:cytochrome P450 [Rhodococcus qingshengii]MBT2271934.1 cytochrome P450 [Rhodococcus qingshengii]
MTLDAIGYEPVFALEKQALKCPYEHFAAAREKCPVNYSSDLGFWVISDHEYVTAALRDTVTYSTGATLGPLVEQQWQMLVDKAAASPGAKEKLGKDYGKDPRKTLLFAEPPAHVKHRKLIAEALSPRAIKSWEPQIRETAEFYVAHLDGATEIDFVADFANPYTMAVIADILGLDRDMVPQLLHWADGFNSMLGNPDISDEELNSLVDVRLSFDIFFSDKIEERRAAPTGDMISRIVEMNDSAAEPLNLDELLMVFQLTLVGGSDTSATALSKMMEFLTAHPEQWKAMQENPKCIQPFMDELLRTQAPVQGVFRKATKSTELGGQKIAEGDVVWLSFGAANRDPSVFSDPDTTDTLRKGTAARLTSFGGGPHVCPGSPLTRMELRLILEMLTAKFSGVSLRGDYPDSKKSFLFFGPAQLPVQFRVQTH